MNRQVGSVNRVGRSTVGKLGAREVKAQAIGAGHHVNKCLEVGVAYWPRDWREVVVQAAHSDCPVNRLLRGVANCTIDQQNLLICLVLC